MKTVELVRLFLADQRGLLRKALKEHIRDNSDELDFEEAANWRDILGAVEKYWNNPRWRVWLDNAVDTYEYEMNDADLTVVLVTQRGRNVVGRKVFTFSGGEILSPQEVIAEILITFYLFHVPREIHVPLDLPDRKRIAEDLSLRFGHEVKILVTQNKKRVASGRALVTAHDESELDKIKPKLLQGEMARILRDVFSLSCAPKKVVALDVAHISGQGFVAASSVWNDDDFRKSEYEFHFSGASSELNALADAVVARLNDESRASPELVVIDGGKPQLNAVLRAISESKARSCGILAAVKPAGRHSAISRFLLIDGSEVPFDANDPSHSMLRLLRDDAHDLANRVHRDLRDMGHHYELAAILPGLGETERRKLIARLGSVKKLLAVDKTELIALAGKDDAEAIIADINAYLARQPGPILPFVVPVRFDAEGGNAEDLRPIAAN